MMSSGWKHGCGMRFKIHGADRETGEESVFELDCPTVQDARANANAAGFLVNKIEPLAVSPPSSRIEHANRKPSSLALSCPKCGSENSQRLCVIHQAGTTKTNSTGQLKAVQNPYLWPIPDSTIRGTINSAGIEQSDLARLAAPPSPPEAPDDERPFVAVVLSVPVMLIVFFWRFVVTPGFLGGILSGLIGLTVVIFLLALVLGVLAMQPPNMPNPEAVTTYQKRKREWEKKFLCLRCGCIYIPRNVSEKQD